MQKEAHVNQGIIAVSSSLIIVFFVWIGAQLLTVPLTYSLPLSLLVGLITGTAIVAWSGKQTRIDPVSVQKPIVDWARAPADIDEALYWDLFENASDIVFTVDVSGHFVTGNRAVERLLGYTVQEAQQLTWEKLVAPYEMDKARRMFKRHARGERFINYELDVTVKGGQIRTFEIGSRPLFKGHHLVGFHGIARDVTERKRIQEAAIEARREAEQASRAKSFFLANMSHEIRTPINGILGFLSLLAKTDLDHTQKHLLQPIEQSAGNLLRIVNDILDLSKIEAGKITIDKEVFCLRHVIEGAVELQRTFAQEKSLQLSTKVDTRTPKQLMGDATRIAQVVGNLVNNAIKFTEQGQVLVSVQVLDDTNHSVRVLLSVRDTGIGIPSHLLRRLYEPFQQLETAKYRHSSGSGLGLTITKNLVTAMGGELEIDSEPGTYTVANVFLSLSKPSDEISSVTLKHPSFDGEGLRVLVVDDNDINLQYLVALLQSFNCRTLEANSGYEAIDIFRLKGVDLVLMDLHMAGIDGVETTRQIRNLPGAKKVPVVAVSADVMGDKAAWIAQGFAAFIGKPVHEHSLCQLLVNLFAHRMGQANKATHQPGLERQSNANGYGDQLLDEKRGIWLASGQRELWQRSVGTLMHALPSDMTVMHRALQEQDYVMLASLAHRLKGSARYVAASELEQCALEVERLSKAAQSDAVRPAFHELLAAVDRFRNLAKVYLEFETK